MIDGVKGETVLNKTLPALEGLPNVCDYSPNMPLSLTKGWNRTNGIGIIGWDAGGHT